VGAGDQYRQNKSRLTDITPREIQRQRSSSRCLHGLPSIESDKDYLKSKARLQTLAQLHASASLPKVKGLESI
jgi:hypothetical protein